MKLKYKGVFSGSYCCYGNLLCHKIDSNLFTNDWAVFWYHDFGINRYRVVIMSHQTLSLGKYWKLFQVTLNISFISIICRYISLNRKRTIPAFENDKLNICRGRKSQLVVSCQVVTNPYCSLAIIFCSFISHLIGRETMIISEIFSGVHGFTGKTVIVSYLHLLYMSFS